MSSRYAIYFAPSPQTLLWQTGCRWLGRDPASDRALEQPLPPGASADWVSAITAAARWYGFHATLKAPFALRAAVSENALRAELEAFAARRVAVALPTLEVATLSGFLALRPVADSAALAALARDCVVDLDWLRAPASSAELARRRLAGLSARQDAMLQRYGYPYVLDEFRFHLTLTDRLADARAQPLRTWLTGYFAAAIGQPATVDALCLFKQATPEAPFRLVRRYEFLANPD